MHPAALLTLLALVSSLSAQTVSFHVPPDGGTPRHPARIQKLGSREFLIRATAEEARSVLRHAVSRVDLICSNIAPEPVTVTLRLDLSGDGQRTEFDTKPEGGMPSRDFLFIQTPGNAWTQVNGRTEGWTSIVSFAAAPGETKVGVSPWYSYADHLRYIRVLPVHPHLTKQLLGKSDGGRDHWELTITDPAAPKSDKRVIFWHAREHAYETFSSFAMEGAVEFLLSDAAADYRRRFIIVLHPMTNVDGVHDGYEYRGGYDFPDPRGTATGRMTFDTVDRLRPHYAVAWHNWIAPRDQDVVFYTDSHDGKATARAWHLFTQRFPSPRSAGHRWRDEANPSKYNWHGRPLSTANVHQYTMKQHGTRVWGWELPWWQRSTADAHKAGADFARAFLLTLIALQADKPFPTNEAALIETPLWQMHEFVLRARSQSANPFRDAAVVGEFISPSGRTNIVDGFFDGEDVWRLRFAPNEQGDWTYLLRGEGVELFQRGRLRCTAPRTSGPIGIDPKNRFGFAYADGTPFFPMGDTCYGLHDDSPITPELRAAYLKTRREQRFNFVRMHVYSSRDRASTDRAWWPWGGTSEKPDLDRFNPAYFRSLDELFRELRAAGMNVELLLQNFYRPPFTNPEQWIPRREQAWLRYIIARYGAFDNLFLWTLANEYETHPDGRYRLDKPADIEWAKSTARFIKANDAHHHLFTVHPVVSASTRGASPRDPIDPPWRIGEFYGKDSAFDVLSQQTGAHGTGATWDAEQQCWTGDDENLVASLRADRRYGKPVLNSEFGYEYLRGHPTEKKQVHHTDKVRRSAWRIVCAGGWFAAGFHGTIGHSDVWNHLDAPNRYTFTIADEGAAAQLAALHKLFENLPLSRLQPFAIEQSGKGADEILALGEPGKLYVLYFPHGGTATLRTESQPMTQRWFNPRTGKFITEASSPRLLQHTAPDTNDWTLLLQLPEP